VTKWEQLIHDIELTQENEDVHQPHHNDPHLGHAHRRSHVMSNAKAIAIVTAVYVALVGIGITTSYWIIRTAVADAMQSIIQQ
jgi:hypothetical protein